MHMLIDSSLLASLSLFRSCLLAITAAAIVSLANHQSSDILFSFMYGSRKFKISNF